ncbi:Flavin carrier protein 2, partial [Nakaseomyces glabratus]
MLLRTLYLWLVLLISSATASQKHLKTSSLLTCMDNSQFTASFFDVKFYPHNKTVIFKVDASTIINGKIVVKAELIAYGLKVLDKTFNLCSLNEVSLCPLASGRIDVSSSYQIDSDVTDQIPGIAYTIPDLDAQIRVVAYSEDDTDYKTPLACVQAILSNDKTVQTKYASWPIAAVSGLGLLTAGFVSVIGYSATSAHIASNSISLFIYFQNLAITAMMGVSRVPPMAAAWTQNFQWSMGIISVEFMQKALDWYIQATNGVSTVVVSNKDILSISVQRRAWNLLKRGISVASSSDSNFDSILDDSQLYTTNERNTENYSNKILVLRGIQRVAFKANIELSNFFLTGVVFFLFFVFCLIIGLIFFKALLELLTRAKILPETSNFFQYRKNWGSIIKGTLFRLAIIAFPQITLLTIWEFTQRDSPAAVVDAVVMFLIVTGLLIYGTTRVFIKGRESLRLYKNPAYLLYSDTNFLNRYGFLYVQFKADTFWWLLPLLTYAFFRSLFVAVLQTHGKAQAMIIFLIELFYFVALCYYRPYLDKRTNVFNIAIHLVNFINALFFLFFSNLFKQPAVVSSVMAVILFVLNAAFALFLLVFTIITCTLALLHRNPDVRYQQMKDDRV